MQSFAPSILIERRSNLKIKARYFPIFAGNRIRVYETVGGKRKAETIYEAVSSRTTARGAELAARDRIKRPFPWGSSIAAPQPIGVSSQCRDGTRGHFAEKQKHVPLISFSFPSPSLNLRCSANAPDKNDLAAFLLPNGSHGLVKGIDQSGKDPRLEVERQFLRNFSRESLRKFVNSR